ncbi:MAG: TonB C-terminal domain-containing protein [Nitrospirae bacterium]|nr:TonB C-terminal domain-containing protein [Nitrospirota bacterium]MCL5284396.1 TonB C-terminal domain-containing protein [Nitrospirota bacterium]
MIRARVRSTGERGVGWFILLSLSLHGLFLVAVLLHKKPVSLGYQTATTVDLVSESALTPSAPPPQPKPAPRKAPARKVSPPKPVKKPRPVVHKSPSPRVVRKPSLRKPRPLRKPVPAKKTPTRGKKAVLPRKVSPVRASTPSKTVRGPRALPKSLPSPLTPTVPVRMDVAGERFPSYLQHLLISRIKSNWAPPPGSHGLNATVHFVLKKDGTLESDPVLVTSSGSQVFDNAAKFAILRSVPFPPFPPSYGKDREVVTVTLQATKRQGF